ncbi:hypothetical protein [Streptomyces atratus]|uniref:Uncharacterized protein n=1 Tax=Streptomyces atratus TaxID=1893 RepID=A0A2Z5JFV2_STRAR|nr:hypothetical protein [Streptomyces atratus]AXE79133.1 hypothetical protein C5746_21865 [Streptomyces atratus]WPW30216.1 hypothetical protein P6B95_24480 [Streptomyces atratus]
MSRTQWCCLVAVLAVALGLFCGPATAAAGDAGRTAVAAAEAGAERAAASAALGRDAASTGPALATASAVDRHGAPGCGKSRKHEDGEPALPGRTRAAYDQAPGLAAWGLPAAAGQGPVRPPVRIKLHGPAAAAPTPVELSVLRV